MSAMSTRIPLLAIGLAAISVALLGCPAAETKDGGAGGGDGDALATRRVALGLGDDAIEIEEAMNAIDEAFYDGLMEAAGNAKPGDAVDPGLRLEHYFGHVEPERAEHKTDARFQELLGQAKGLATAAAAAGLADDLSRLQETVSALDKTCATCHKAFRKKEDH